MEPGVDELSKLLAVKHSRYEQIRFVARGAYGFVTQALDKESGQHVALKFIKRGGKITKYVEREIINQLRLRHPHIIDLQEVFLTDDHLVLVMEFAGGGDLLGRVTAARRLPEDEARWYFQQVMFAVDYCHRMGVSNRDIKLENTLLLDVPGTQRALAKLADFGFSKDENYHSAPGSRVGTPAYLAPEVISNVDGKTYDAKKADVWSCGVLLFVMVAGRYPFQRSEDEGVSPGQRLHNMMQRILQGRFKFPTTRELSEPLKDLICKMLVADPLQRPSVQEVLSHPWTAHGLHPSVLRFNDPIVASSLTNPPSREVVDEIKSIVQEARALPESTRCRPPLVPPAHAAEARGLGGVHDSSTSFEELGDDILDMLDLGSIDFEQFKVS